MLVLTRKVGQRIRIGDSIVLSVVRIKGAGVRIGIEAPQGVAVVRDELGPPLHEVSGRGSAADLDEPAGAESDSSRPGI